MTRQPHDQFAKQYLEELLAPLGTVETSRDVPSEVRQVDVWFVPASSPSTDSSNLGLLGKMAATACLFEPFRNAPTVAEIHGCLLKLYSLRAELLRKARREKRSVSEDELPLLWILSPSCSQRLLNGFGAKLSQDENWGEGVSKQELLLWFGEGSGQDLRLGEGGREKVENLLRVRFGEIDAELADKIASMLQLPHQELTPLLLTRSREELLEGFAG